MILFQTNTFDRLFTINKTKIKQIFENKTFSNLKP